MGKVLLRRQYPEVTEAATAIWDHTQEHGGGTFAASTGELNEYTRGYVVSKGTGTIKLHIEEDRDVAINLIAMFIQQQPLTGRFLTRPNIGTWTDGDVIHVDAVELVDDLLDAISLGIERGELAIWDNEAEAEIRL